LIAQPFPVLIAPRHNSLNCVYVCAYALPCPVEILGRI
jgi:hypothetical protein